MDVITYAKNNKFKLELIPPGNQVTSYMPSGILIGSREKISDMQNINEEKIPFNINSIYCDADSNRIKYFSPFNEVNFIQLINSQSNIVDKFLCLNPKQIGIVNNTVDILFDYGNQLHYLVCKNSLIDVFEKNYGNSIPSYGSERLPIQEDNIVFFDENNTKYISYGGLNLNNILFASLLFRFDITKNEKNLLTFNSNLNVLCNVSDVKSLPHVANYNSSAPSTLSGSYIIYGTSSIDNIDVKREATDFQVVNVDQTTGFTVIESPLNFVNEKSIYNENIIIDRTHPLWEGSRITIRKSIDYTSAGSDITYLDSNTNLSTMDELLKSIYSWKSCLMILEKENTLWDANSNLKPRYTYEFLLLVGIKTKDYKITEKIESLFYITAGDNYINNPNFSSKDIFFIKSPLKKILNLYKPDAVHFFDLSNADYGNICKNGLLFGMESDLQKNIIGKINNKDNQFIKTRFKIENLYELFEQL